MRRIKFKELAGIKKKLLRQQRGRCALCGMELKDDKDICLDHDHKQGFIRAILCRNCNAMEGKVFNCANRAKRGGTRAEWLEAVLMYWQKHEKCRTGLIHHTHKTDAEKRKKANKKAKLRREKKKKETMQQGKTLLKRRNAVKKRA